MKKIGLFCVSLFLFIFSTLLFAAPPEKTLGAIVAVINDEVITTSEFQQALNDAKLQITQSGMALPSAKVLNKQVLDQLINKKIQLQLASAQGINVDDSEVSQAIHRIATDNQLSVDTLYQKLNQEGISKQKYRINIHDQLTMQKLQQKEIIEKIAISPEEVNTFMRSQAWQNNDSKEYRLQNILIPVSDTPSPQELAEAKKRADAILVKIHQGQSFREAALAESGDNHAFEGGDLGWRKLPEIPSAFAEQVTHLQKGETAGPLQASNGFHLIQLTDVRKTTANQAALEPKQIERLILERKFEEHLQHWISKLRAQAFIKTNPVA